MNPNDQAFVSSRIDDFPEDALFAIGSGAIPQTILGRYENIASPIRNTTLVTRDTIYQLNRRGYRFFEGRYSEYEGIFYASFTRQQENSVPPAQTTDAHPSTPPVAENQRPRPAAPPTIEHQSSSNPPLRVEELPEDWSMRWNESARRWTFWNPELRQWQMEQPTPVTPERVEEEPSMATASTSRTKKVICQVWPFTNSDPEFYANAFQTILLPHLSKSIKMSGHVSGSLLRLRNDERYFHVYMGGSTQRPSNNTYLQNSCFGLQNPITSLGRIGPVDDPTLEHLETPEGDVVASIGPNCAYIYQAFGSIENAACKALFKKIVEKLAHYVREGSFPNEAGDTTELENLYVQSCTRRVNTTLQQLERDVVAKKGRYEQYAKEIVRLYREVQQSEARLQALKENSGNENESYKREFRGLLNNPNIERLAIREDKLYVYTKNITIKTTLNDNQLRNTPGLTAGTHEFDIGKFEIMIPMNGGSLVFKNRTRTVRSFGNQDMHHPHVFQHGNACLGTADASIPVLIAEYQYAAVANLAISFLKSVNPADSAGQWITSWPRVGDNGTTRLAAATVRNADNDDYDDDDE